MTANMTSCTHRFLILIFLFPGYCPLRKSSLETFFWPQETANGHPVTYSCFYHVIHNQTDDMYLMVTTSELSWFGNAIFLQAVIIHLFILLMSLSHICSFLYSFLLIIQLYILSCIQKRINKQTSCKSKNMCNGRRPITKVFNGSRKS